MPLRRFAISVVAPLLVAAVVVMHGSMIWCGTAAARDGNPGHHDHGPGPADRLTAPEQLMALEASLMAVPELQLPFGRTQFAASPDVSAGAAVPELQLRFGGTRFAASPDVSASAAVPERQLPFGWATLHLLVSCVTTLTVAVGLWFLRPTGVASRFLARAPIDVSSYHSSTEVLCRATPTPPLLGDLLRC